MKLSKTETFIAWMQIAMGTGLVVFSFSVPFKPLSMLIATVLLGMMLAMIGVHILNIDSNRHW